MQTKSNKLKSFFRLAGMHYWTSSLLPALIGTTLPFWLNPPGFKFRFVGALLFLVMTLMGHTGFVLLHNALKGELLPGWTKRGLLVSGFISLFLGVFIGVYLNSSLQLHDYVPDYIFIIYGFTTIFIGVLYVFPPFSFYKRIFGEVVLCIGMGLMPVLGAYLIQVGDITRTVYLASLPVVISTGLWFWIIQLIDKPNQERLGYHTTITHFPDPFSRRYLPLLLTTLIYLSLVLVVIVRSSLNPLSLLALFSIMFAIKINQTTWNLHNGKKHLMLAAKYVFWLHLFISIIIVLASLSSVVSNMTKF